MPGSIVPLPVMLEEEDQKIYDQLQPPTSMVVRYGFQKKIAELPYDGDAKPGCGSKLVVRTERGVELAEMLTTTCPNSGCFKSVSRKQVLTYIENSGGKDFPFSTEGKVLRVATIEDLNAQSALDNNKPEKVKAFKRLAQQHNLEMKLVEVEHLLENDRVVFFYQAEDRIDFREMVKDLATELATRIEMVQVNDREEARLVADYEKCGQQCCCKNFLKVLKPISMRSAKVQKATLDPQKISGRCGRLMCCLRYEDETYESLRKKLPHKKTRVLTDDGEGIVLNTQILTQLVLVLLDSGGKPAAYPLENIQIIGKGQPQGKKPSRKNDGPQDGNHKNGGHPRKDQADRDNRQEGPSASGNQANDGKPQRNRSRKRRPKPGQPLQANEVESKEGTSAANLPSEEDNTRQAGDPNAPDGKRRRRRRNKPKPQQTDDANSGNTAKTTQENTEQKKPPHPKHPPSAAASGNTEGIVRKKRRRRRRGRGKKPGEGGTPPNPPSNN